MNFIEFHNGLRVEQEEAMPVEAFWWGVLFGMVIGAMLAILSIVLCSFLWHYYVEPQEARDKEFVLDETDTERRRREAANVS